MRKIFIFFFCFILLQINAQSDFRPFNTKNYKVEDGLSQSWVLSIHQDYMGFMWFGTGDGLNQFDGYNFKVFKHNPRSNTSLKNNEVTSICEDNNNRLWIGTSTGICLYERATETFTSDSAWPENYITDFLVIGNHILITSDVGLFQLDTKTKIIKRLNINGTPILDGIYLTSIDKDYYNNIWVGGHDGLYVIYDHFKNLKKIDYDSSKKTPQMVYISSITCDSDNNIWAGTEINGLFRLKYKNLNSVLFEIESYQTIANKSGTLSKGMIRTMLQDCNGNIWLAIENAGLDIINPNRTINGNAEIKNIAFDPKNEKGISSNSIHAIYEDSRGDLWFGTYGGGINFYNTAGENFRHIKSIPERKNSLINNNVNVFFELNSEIWIGTEGGLSVYNEQKKQYTSFPNVTNNTHSNSSDAIWSITKDHDGNLWIGTWAGGVSKVNPDKMFFRQMDIGRDMNPNVFSVLEDSDNQIWIGTMGGGLVLYNPATKKNTVYRNDLNNPYSISNDWVRQVYNNSLNELWISTSSAVDLFDRKKQQFIHFFPNINDTNTISGKGAYVIFEDSKNNMWFGTDVGLNYFKRSDSSFVFYQETDGLPNNSVKGILEDDHGNLWISTNRGISKFENAVDLPSNPVFQSFDLSDGLQGNEFNRRAAFKSSNGEMYFGGTNGYNVFHPDSLKKNETEPRVVLTNLLVSNKKVEPGKHAAIAKHISMAGEIVLKYQQSVFTIEYAGLSFVNSYKNQYSYMLEGFDKGWNNVGTQRSATYTNLNPGEYIFKVKASNNDDIWNTTGASIKIIILPPWYRTSLAYFIYLIFILSLVLILRRLILMRTNLQHEIKLKQIEKEKLDEVHQVKTQFYTNISHEFRTPLTLIIGPLEKILSTTSFKPDVGQQFQVILKNARRMLRLINQFLDLSTIEAGYLKLSVHEGNIPRYIQAISDIFEYEAKQKKIIYNFESTHDTFLGWFDSDKIEKILYNLLSNAIKYTAENQTIKFMVQFNPPDEVSTKFPGYMEMWVKDTGIGISDEEKTQIFNRYYQAKSTSSSNAQGSGIGLSLVSGLVEKYGGNIEIKSSPGQGTSFYVRLPYMRNMFSEESIVNKSEEDYLSKLENYYQPASDKEQIEGLKAGFDKTRSTLLVVEDNVDLLNYIADHFKKHFNVHEATNGEEGKAIALAKNPDIIVTDIMMPGIDGMELCKQLKQNEKTSHIPIIILTAKASDESHVEGLGTGADGFLSKPFNIDVLEARVRNLLDSRKKLKQAFSQKINIEPKDIAITSVDATFIQKAINLVEKHMADPDFSTDFMSKEIGMSRASLHRKLIALTDLPPSGFIRELRMKRAARLLVEGQRTVSEVLYEIGIRSRSYFTKSFKEAFGMSPTEYVDVQNGKLKNKPSENL
ncbi:MAG: response regulator [Bacteroidales bacterium]|nr:response regulator [Bacteroidales bacterium]MBN2818834.1 response regulator [Bacteroidales bacterium]